jgi:hypothetical protein
MKKLIYILLAVALFSQSACKKQLDALPKNAEVEGNAIVDEPSANVALNGVYYCFANASNISTNWNNNKIMGSLFAGYIGSGNGATNDETDIFGATTYGTEWGRYYTLINAANGVNQDVQTLADNKFTNGRKTQILAEARFLRAFGHFKLLSYFGQWFDITSPYGVIIESQFNTLTNINLPRSTVKDCYTFILSDLDYAIANAADAGSNVYANKWTAMALKMRVLISRAQGDDLAQAITLANTIISGSPYALEPNEKDIFYTKGLTSNEVMLGIQPQANQNLYYSNSSEDFIGASAFYEAKPDLYTLLKNDPRAGWVIGAADTTNVGNYYFIKYIQPAKISTQLSEVAYAFRLSEVYLMLAEATVRSGGDLNAAKNTLKTVMSKAGVTDFTAINAAVTANDVAIQIYYEYARNFVGEDGIEWMALLRLPLATVQQLRPTITSNVQYILPIPHAEFVSNPNIGPQNPGYSK